MEPISELIEVRKRKMEELKALGIKPYPQTRFLSSTSEEVKRLYGEKNEEELEKEMPIVRLAGRIISFRDFGKSVFFHIQDRKGKIQVYVRKDVLQFPSYEAFKKLDIGDIVGVEGSVFKTKTKELTVLAKTVTLLAKSLRPLPEKWHGLKDVEERYRKRYLDLIVNEKVREIFVKRSKITNFIRTYLTERDFLEVETPMMHLIPGGAEAKPFVTHHNALNLDLYLRIAPELHLKRLVVGGFERVFEINRNFRNEGISVKHNPEFTMLEFYQAYATYEDLMVLLEELIFNLVTELTGTTTLSFKGHTIDFRPPWKKYTINEALKLLGGIDVENLNTYEALQAIAKDLGIHDLKDASRGKILTKLFEVVCEDKLIDPTFITHYPVDVSPLAKRSEENPDVVERFELYIGGMEIANGFNELNDPFDQRDRFLKQAQKKGEEYPIDEDYIVALEHGMPPTAGCGVGIDRLVMILTDSPSIREVILFPLLKP
ncbi:MAG: lysine--tRNA ligase [Desulfobacterota bacterium]|nr:lysine--tRNA ligase [Thermodesulfobacteriota bacterium]MDW8001608.1 lysine--tRNA ligase [Deltaproteobacteria bacterium]